MKKIDISIVVPVYNEQDSILTLFDEINESISEHSWELIFINDGSTDSTKNQILKLVNQFPNVILIDSFTNQGKSESLNAGFSYAHGNIVLTIDGDLQDDPSEINRFIDSIENSDLVCGWKQNRKDPLTKTIPSRFFNFILRSISGIKLNDFNCGFKAYKKHVAKSLTLYGGLHRFIPVLAKKNGFKIKELAVKHRKRKYGQSKYGTLRMFHGFFDLITVLFLNRYFTKPLHFFGFVGFLLSFIGISINLYLTYFWFYYNYYIDIPINYTINRPLLFFGILSLIVGFQLISIGLIGELIVRYYKKENSNIKNYNVIE